MQTRTITHKDIIIHHVNGHVPHDFWTEAYHSHDHAEIFIHIKGKMELFIENNVYYHNADEIRVYAPQELHFGKSDYDQDMEWYQITIYPSFLKAYPDLFHKIIDRPKGFENVFISKKHKTLISLIEEIYKKQESPLGQHYLWANIIKILCILSEPENTIYVSMGKNECLQKILETINQKLTYIKTIDDVSKYTHFSPSYIYRLFKNHLNITPHKYIVMKKLSIAKELLSSGSSIYEACFLSGFDDYSNFITAFRKHFGVTPKNHQKSNT